jgi:homoserine kinase
MDEQGAVLVYICGAGSTLMAMVPGADADFDVRLRASLDANGFAKWRLLMLDADNIGAICVESRSLEF